MNYFWSFFILTLTFVACGRADDTTLLIDTLLGTIKTALNADAVPEIDQNRERQYPYRPQNNGISLGVYEALRSIAKNDELECVSRLLCEAAAGGRPGFSGKQITFDKLSLTSLISYLKLDVGDSSPLLVFGKAALLGVSNRGDPYSCIINYPKCPKDQSRLLYYLNNHKGGFFRYFNSQYYKPGNYYNQQYYRPGYAYQKYQKHFQKNKIQFESPVGSYEKLKKKASNNIYAPSYSHSTLTFPKDSSGHKPMVFPKKGDAINPRILTKPVRAVVNSNDNDFFFYNSNRFSKKLNDFNFFPQNDNIQNLKAAVPTDRLPSKFYFPANDESYYKYPNSPNSFFPTT